MLPGIVLNTMSSSMKITLLIDTSRLSVSHFACPRDMNPGKTIISWANFLIGLQRDSESS